MSEFESTEALVEGEVSVEIVGYFEDEPAPAEETPVSIEPIEYAPALDIIAFTEALPALPETETLVLYLPGVEPTAEAETPPIGKARLAYDLELRSRAA
jgi:hypothetical protein